MTAEEQEQTQTIDLGSYRGIVYTLTLRGKPDLRDPPEFAVVAHYKRAERGSTEIVRIDTKHGETHVHRRYLQSQPREPLEVDLWEASEYILSNWEEFARKFHRNHGE